MSYLRSLSDVSPASRSGPLPSLGRGSGKPWARAPQTAPTEALAGLVERVTYHNAENGFCVLRVKARGQRDLVTVVGHAATIAAGEWVQLSGTWVNDRTHGLQFRAAFLKASPPTTLEGIERYLGSGMIRGIGPVYAKKLVRAFGEAVFDLIEAEPERLREVDRHRPQARRAHRRRLGRAEGGPRDHAVPARPWGRHLAGGADLQDLRRRGRAGDHREPLPPGPRHPRHRLPTADQIAAASSASSRRP